MALSLLGWSYLIYLPTEGITIALFLTAAGIGAVMYRDSLDPALVFLATGGATYGLSAAIPLLLAPTHWLSPQALAESIPPSPRADLPLLMALTSVIALGVCLLGTVPWWERRGRPPLSASKVAALVLGLTAAVDALLFVFPPPRIPQPIDGVIGYRLGPVPWLLASAGCLVCAVASWRAIRASDRAPFFGLVGVVSATIAAWSLAILLTRFVTPTSTKTLEVITGWLMTTPVVAGAALVAALLTSLRGERRHMRRATDRAEAVLDGRAEIASMVAHEVRGPVATVRGIASTALTHYDRLSDDERREFLAMIQTESGHLMDTVDQTSLALKVDAGTLRYDMRSHDLELVIRDGLQRAATGDRAVDIICGAPVIVSCDRARLSEVVRQLVNNAVKFSPEGSPITISLGRDGSHAVMDVVDQGPGIPPEQRERIFERYPKWRPAGYEEQPGTGLGLFIARGIAGEHGGDVHVQDRAGGTMLRVLLPEEGKG